MPSLSRCQHLGQRPPVVNSGGGEDSGGGAAGQGSPGNVWIKGVGIQGYLRPAQGSVCLLHPERVIQGGGVGDAQKAFQGRAAAVRQNPAHVFAVRGCPPPGEKLPQPRVSQGTQGGEPGFLLYQGIAIEVYGTAKVQKGRIAVHQQPIHERPPVCVGEKNAGKPSPGKWG